MKKVLFFLFLVVFLAWAVARLVLGINFDFNCKNYLKLAADANTVEMAKPQLDKAIKYLEEHNMTEGIVSIFFKNPKNDVGFFYQNLKVSRAELERLSPESTQLEESNVLMKLRESLVDEGESTTVTRPDGISIYPNNVAYFLWSILSLFGMIIFGAWWIFDEY